MLHIENICIAFGTEVLVSGFNMKLERGETACIVGQSGCGKTSLLNAIMGFVPLKEGIIRIGGMVLDKSTIDTVRRQIAWIPQELALPFEWVKEMVALPFGLKVNRSVPFSEERLFACFDELGLERTEGLRHPKLYVHPPRIIHRQHQQSALSAGHRREQAHPVQYVAGNRLSHACQPSGDICTSIRTLPAGVSILV